MRDDRFKIDDATLTHLAKAFSINKKMVATMDRLYSAFSPLMRKQYLAHAMRGLEVYFRKLLKNENFKIICEPYKRNASQHPLKPVYSTYSNLKTNSASSMVRNHCFIIHYDASLSVKDLKVHLAHAIGHLFLEVFARDTLNKKGNVYKELFKLDVKSLEKLSSIFGFFLLAEENDFYRNRDFKSETHKDLNELIDSFGSCPPRHSR